MTVDFIPFDGSNYPEYSGNYLAVILHYPGTSYEYTSIANVGFSKDISKTVSPTLPDEAKKALTTINEERFPHGYFFLFRSNPERSPLDEGQVLAYCTTEEETIINQLTK